MASLARSFLVARTVLKDPSFSETVVLLLQHSGEGAFGLVVNRPAAVEGLAFPVFVGGPCEPRGLLMLHGHAEWVDVSVNEVAPGIYLGDAACLNRVSKPAADPSLRYRLFTGYAGWGPDQLERELAAGAWSVVPATAQLLFETPAEDLWTQLLPPAIPQFSAN